MPSNQHTYFIARAGFFAFVLGMLVLLVTPSPSRAQATIHLGDFERLSVGTGNTQSNGSSYHAFASADGRYVGFISLATNLAPESPTNDTKCLPTLQCIDLFLRDRVADTTIRLSNGMDGKQANNSSFEPHISSDGKLIHFDSYADDMVPNDTNNVWPYYGSDGFIWNRDTGALTRETLRHNGQQVSTDSVSYMPGIGTMIYFQTDASGVVEGVTPGETAVYRRDLATGLVTHIPVSQNNVPMNGTMINLQSDVSGRFVVFTSYASNVLPGDNNNLQDVFVHDTQTGVTKLVSRTPSGAFGNADSGAPMISPDGTHIVFRSSASNLIANDTNGVDDIYMYDIATTAVQRVSLTESGGQGNGASKDPAVCNGGKLVAFGSDATNLVAGDTNGKRDIFIHHTETGAMAVATRTESGIWTDDKSHKSRFIDDCSGLLFATDGNNLMAEDTNGERDLFYRSIAFESDISTSTQTMTGSAEPGATITHTITLHNSGGIPTSVHYEAALPANTTFSAASAPGVYDATTEMLTYDGTLAAGASVSFTFTIVIDASLTQPTAVLLDGSVASSSQTIPLVSGGIVNGFDVYLPIVNAP